MEKHIEVIGIDHGWANMKTATQIFTTGVKEIWIYVNTLDKKS